MQNELFVAQLDWSVTENELGDLFAQYGEVVSVRIPVDKMTGRKRGFAFIAMADNTQAQSAVDALNEWELKGRNIVVKFAEPKPANAGGGYGRSGGQSRGGFAPRNRY